MAALRLKQARSGAVIRWYKAAARQGDSAAQDNLGIMYQDGEGVPGPDPLQALKWYRAAARQGDPAGLCNLAGMYHSGEAGLPPDSERAFQLYREAAKLEWADAQYNVGICYVRGIGVQPDSGEALRWFRAAAKQDHPEAMCFVGAAYLGGEGVEQDGAEAAKWFRAAAARGSAAAEVSLGDEPIFRVGNDESDEAQWFSTIRGVGRLSDGSVARFRPGRPRRRCPGVARRLHREPRGPQLAQLESDRRSGCE